MKRRNAEYNKLRRPIKRGKITEGIYGSTFLYLKFLLVWALVLMADFILEFRFEYLWPFWLLMRSVYDSFKYQGLAFSVFFVCIAVTSDVICYLFIPVQWLFFAASTYVWVQYVWHTERGICLPTVSLWLLFVYIEASVRLREFKGPPYHLDLCRPFAAHCIGYPVVTLGFGFKSYVSYRLRLRKQKDVQKENEFYIQLLQQALPPEQQHAEKQKALPSKSQEEEISKANGVANTASTHTPSTSASGGGGGGGGKKSAKVENTTDKEKDVKKHNNPSNSHDIEDYQYIEQQPPSAKKNTKDLNEYDSENIANDAKTFKANGMPKNSSKLISKDNVSRKGGKQNNTPFTNNKDEVISRLEGDIKRLKADLQSSRNCEQELRSQINTLVISDKGLKSEFYQLQQDNESLQTKLHNLVTTRQQDKQNISTLERKLQDERKQKSSLEQQLSSERKKKTEETARAIAMATASRGECTEACKARRREVENELKQIRRELKLREDQTKQLERETQTLRQYKDAQNETEVLMSALTAMQEKNTHLENNLSAETRLKLDLFSALGDAKRQIEIQQGLLAQKEVEISDVKSKIAEVMALIPANSTPFTSVSLDTSPSPHFSATFAKSSPEKEEDVLARSSLNPNASDYCPKVSN